MIPTMFQEQSFVNPTPIVGVNYSITLPEGKAGGGFHTVTRSGAWSGTPDFTFHECAKTDAFFGAVAARKTIATTLFPYFFAKMCHNSTNIYTFTRSGAVWTWRKWNLLGNCPVATDELATGTITIYATDKIAFSCDATHLYAAYIEDGSSCETVDWVTSLRCAIFELSDMSLSLDAYVSEGGVSAPAFDQPTIGWHWDVGDEVGWFYFATSDVLSVAGACFDGPTAKVKYGFKVIAGHGPPGTPVLDTTADVTPTITDDAEGRHGAAEYDFTWVNRQGDGIWGPYSGVNFADNDAYFFLQFVWTWGTSELRSDIIWLIRAFGDDGVVAYENAATGIIETDIVGEPDCTELGDKAFITYEVKQTNQDTFASTNICYVTSITGSGTQSAPLLIHTGTLEYFDAESDGTDLFIIYRGTATETTRNIEIYKVADGILTTYSSTAPDTTEKDVLMRYLVWSGGVLYVPYIVGTAYDREIVCSHLAAGALVYDTKIPMGYAAAPTLQFSWDRDAFWYLRYDVDSNNILACSHGAQKSNAVWFQLI